MKLGQFCEFDRRMYIGDGLRGKPKGLLRLLIRRRSTHRNFYLIYMDLETMRDGNGRLEVQHTSFLRNEYYRRHPIHVFGVAKTYEEAGELLVQISDEAAADGRTGDLAGFLMEREGGR